MILEIIRKIIMNNNMTKVGLIIITAWIVIMIMPIFF